MIKNNNVILYVTYNLYNIKDTHLYIYRIKSNQYGRYVFVRLTE